MSEHMTRTHFEEAIEEALLTNGIERQDFSIEPAWTAYLADPESWHKKTEDNPSGDVGAAFVLAEGPWWREES